MGTIDIPAAFRPLMTAARYKGYWGGRGGGKSRSFASAAVIHAAQKPRRILCCREIQRSIAETVKYTLDATIQEAGLSRFFVSTKYEIRGANGSHFLFEGLGANVLKIQSMADVDIVWVDEANMLSRLSLDTLIPTIRNPGSELWFSWNPRNETDPVDQLFRGESATALPGEVTPAGYKEWMISRKVLWSDNPFFPDVLRAELDRDRRRDPERYAHIWLGEYSRNLEARVFKNWRIEVIDVNETDWRRLYGADWGHADPTAAVRVWANVKTRTIYIDAVVSKSECRIDDIPKLFDGLDGGEARKWVMVADSARPETIEYMKRHGYPRIESARKGAGSVEEGIEFMKSYDIVVHPNCREAIDELTLYSWQVDKITGLVLPKLADKDNHIVDSIRYALEKLRSSTYDKSLGWVG